MSTNLKGASSEDDAFPPPSPRTRTAAGTGTGTGPGAERTREIELEVGGQCSKATRSREQRGGWGGVGGGVCGGSNGSERSEEGGGRGHVPGNTIKLGRRRERAGAGEESRPRAM